MAGENTVSTLNGLFKVVYADKLEDLVPDYAVLQKRVEFVGADKELGNYYAQPVNLAHEAGFTYNGEAGGVTTLNAAVNGTLKEAQVKGTEIILRSQLSYGALARASKAGPKAFKRASGWKVEDMNNSARKRLEISMIYGGSGIGTVESVNSGSGSGSFVITAATWAGGIWAGAEGARLDAYTGSSQNNLQGELKVTAVNADTRTISVTCTGTLSDEIAAGDVVYFRGSYGNDMAGVRKIITNSTTLFNIDAGAFSLWKGTEYSSTGQLSHAKLQDAIMKAVNKGLMEKVLVLVSPKAWGVLCSDQAALRVFDSSYSSSSGKNGFESLSFHSVNGPVEIVAHPMVKDGDAFILPVDALMRIGSTDLTFGVPGMDESFFRLVDGSNAVELQCMADQAIFIEKPAHAVYMSGITYA